MTQVRMNTEQKKFLSELKSGKGIVLVMAEMKILVETIREWKSNVKGFKDKYYEALGITELQEAFLEKYEKHMLNVKAASKAVPIDRTTFYRWRSTNDTFRQMAEEIEQGLKEDVQSIIHQKIFVEKDNAMIMMFAKSKMTDMGYGEKVTNTNLNVSTSKYDDMSIEELEAELAKVQK